MKYNLFFFLVVIFGWQSVYAQSNEESLVERSFPVQRLELAPTQNDFLTTESAEVLSSLAYSFGLLTTFQHNPLTVRTVVDGRLQNTPVPIIKDQLALQLGGAFGLGKKLQVSFGFPVVLSQKGDGLRLLRLTREELDTGGVGDVRLGVKYTLGSWGEGGGQTFSLAVASLLTAPAAQVFYQLEQNQFLGERNFTFTPRLIAEWRAGALEGAANLAYRIRPEATLLSLDVNDEILYSIAGRYRANDKLSAILEVFGGISSFLPAEVDQRPLEIDGAIRYYLIKGLFATGGLGLGLTPGAGAPQYRLFAALGFSARPLTREERDKDQDGIPDKKDKCPEEAEDIDGDRDDDGCYDAAAESVVDPDDEDADDIPNALDQCPGQPEDKDGFEDEDGCPDPDNDQDGINDIEDMCWNEAEDMDGFEDDDGCPDLDNEAQ